MNVFNIERSFKDKVARKWDKLFWAIDLHDTIITGKFNKFNVGAEIYPGVEEVFQWFNKREDMVTILYTSSWPDAVEKTLKDVLTPRGITFDYINSNPECVTGELCDFRQKFYMNVLLDDKAGFDGTVDWINIKNELIRIGEWTK